MLEANLGGRDRGRKKNGQRKDGEVEGRVEVSLREGRARHGRVRGLGGKREGRVESSVEE